MANGRPVRKRRWFVAIAAFLFAGVASADEALPNFAGYYSGRVYEGLDPRSGRLLYSSSQLYVSDTVAGKATIRMYLGDRDSYCGVEGDADVEAKGLTYREETGQAEGPLVLDIAIDGASAVVTWVSGPAKWNCGEHTVWGAVLGRLDGERKAEARDAQARDGYQTAIDCFALYSFLTERAKHERGSEALAKALDDLATNADMQVGNFARAPIAKQVEDENTAAKGLAAAQRRGELTAAVLAQRKAACDAAIEPTVVK